MSADSNPQHDQFENAQGDHQHRERHGVVIEPIPVIYTHGGFPPRRASRALDDDGKRGRRNRDQLGRSGETFGDFRGVYLCETTDAAMNHNPARRKKVSFFHYP